MTRYFKKIVYLFFMMIFLFSFFMANASWAEIRDEVLKEAKKLERVEKEYFKKGLINSSIQILKKQFLLKNLCILRGIWFLDTVMNQWVIFQEE